jgi:hypothetical protein
MPYQNIISAIGLIGIGAILKSIIDYILKKREVKSQTQHEFKNERYKVIILLANALLDFEKNKENLNKHGRDFKAKEDLIDEVRLERDNMILFAGDGVILSLNSFIASPTEIKFYSLALEMRKDLYGLVTRLKPSSLKLK